MSNQEEKKCEFCGGTGMIYKQNMDSEGKVTSYGYKCDCQFPKPSPSQSCEHDIGEAWTSNEVGRIHALLKTSFPTCPFCKPTAVEPSVEEIAEGIIARCVIPEEGAGLYYHKLLDLIAEALRNERNRK